LLRTLVASIHYDAVIMIRFLIATLLFIVPTVLTAQQPIRVAIAGLVHGHVDGFLRLVQNHPEVQIVGVFEPSAELRQQYLKKFSMDEKLFFGDLNKMLEQTKPQAVATFTNTFDHPMIVETVAAKHIAMMMEKPMAVSNDHARRIQAAAKKYDVPVIVNYETSWYPSKGVIGEFFKDKKDAGDIRKMVAMDGHQGPKEIGVMPTFLNFLGDPKQNGAGALFDFGCYGANLMTWLMDNARPVSVSAVLLHVKPQIYPRVDDDATVLVEYRKATGIIQGSWNWPFARKDFEVYGEHGYAISNGGNEVRVRIGETNAAKEERKTPQPLPESEHDSLTYLSAVVRGMKPAGVSSLENNMIVTEILEAARESARTGKKVVLR
jgi:glucose-fructose oxidoreductase